MPSLSKPEVVIAVVDDEIRVANLIAKYLQKEGFKTRTYDKPEVCLKTQKRDPADIIITDLRMPDMDGIEFLRNIKELSPSTDVIMVTGNADKNVAIQALRLGAFDFFEKPVNGDELVETVKRTVSYQSLLRERDHYADQVSELARRESDQWGGEGFIGQTQVVRKLLEDVRLLQKASDISVLIMGKSGTGKELIARAIHSRSARAARPFVPVNCSALPHDLAESLLFGHVKGSFTGATSDRSGCFMQADGGTLFLDEIGDMPLPVQSKLLRVLEDGNIMPVGGARAQHVDVRVVAATNADLKEKVKERSFREDLFFRLSGYILQLPPLRERRDDIPLLAQHFAARLSSDMGMRKVQLSMPVIEALLTYDYPGNVRELKNMIERALIVSGGNVKPENLQFIALDSSNVLNHKPADEPTQDKANDFASIADAEKTAIEKALIRSGGNVAQAARLLKINRTKLYRKLKEYDIKK